MGSNLTSDNNIYRNKKLVIFCLDIVKMPDPQKIPGGAEKFRQSPTYKELSQRIPNLDTVLRENNALIAGGSVLKALTTENGSWNPRYNDVRYPSDIDIYVPIPKDKDVHTLFRNSNQFITGRINYKSSSYCSSFLRQNGIRTVVNYQSGEIIPKVKVDVMAVRKRTTPLQVVQNFDLTFCQVWYDGKDVWATHPEHIQNKSGELQGDYVKVFLSGNMFLRKRMRKYIKRGFKIKADTAGIEATNELLKDFGSTTSICRYNGSSIPDADAGKIWARKTLFRACFQYTLYRHANIYSKEEDGYDSDEYAEDPNKLIELAGSKEELARRIFKYKVSIEVYFEDFIHNPDAHSSEEEYRDRFFTVFLQESQQLCGEEYMRLYNGTPRITFTDENENNDETNYSNNNNNNNETAYENNNESNNNLPQGEERPIGQRPPYAAPEGTEPPTECFDPYMASTVDIAENQVLFYIFNKPVGNAEPTLARVACIDNESEDGGQTIQLYKKFLEQENYIYYKCLATVPQGAIYVSPDQIETEPLRRLAFDQNVYVYETQAKQIQAGCKYALIPTNDALGRIVSKNLLLTMDAVGGEHCQTNYTDKIHEIFEMVAQGGALRFKRLSRKKARKTLKKRKLGSKSRRLRRRTGGKN